MLHTLKTFQDIEDRVRYVRHKRKLMAFENPVVDTDRRELVSRLEALGFSALPPTLAEIDRRASAAATPFDFKAAMDLLRSFFETFMQEASAKIAPKRGVPAPVPGENNTRPFATFKTFLQSAGLLQRDETDLLQNLYNYFSNPRWTA